MGIIEVKKLKNRFLSVKFLRFLIVGGFSTGIDFTLYLILSMRWTITKSKMASMGISSVFSYIANKNYTFHNGEKIGLKSLLRFYGTFAANFGINISVNYIVYAYTGYKIAAYVTATCCGMGVNYLMQKYFVFPDPKEFDK